MTHELILTSVARGLDPSDHGFCPVAVDSVITPRMAQFLFSLSDYDRFFTSAKGFARRKPVNSYSHLILPGGLEHVVTRAADAGLDYQKKPNVLVHHIVLDTIEAPPEGPGWLLALPGFHLSEWNGAPLQFPSGRPIPTLTNPPSLTRRQQIARQFRWLDPSKMTLTHSADSQSQTYHNIVQNNENQITLTSPPTTPCHVWEELTGDPGWGGVLAETVYTEQPVIIIHHLEQNILPLFVEALALLPSYFSWHAAFSTNCTGLPETIPCQWKGVLAGSDDAKRLVKDHNSLVLDLTTPLGKAPEGRYVEFARFGQEYLLPVEAEEQVPPATNMDTKPYGEETPEPKTKISAATKIVLPRTTPSPVIRHSQKYTTGLSEFFLRRTSRFQFYLLYSIMFVLVLILLVFAVDQAGQFGIIERLRSDEQTAGVVLSEPAQQAESELESEADLAESEPEPSSESEDPQKILEEQFNENRQKQKETLVQFWKDFQAPDFLTASVPVVKDSQIDLPEKTTFAELRPLFSTGAALDLLFVSLFELPKMKVETRLDRESLPALLWKVEAVDSETEERTPMFSFQLTDAGLEMNWQPEGLNNQYLYDSILSSLGFLQLSIVDTPETTKEIPLFSPLFTEPIKAADLAKLPEAETPEIAVDMPFASELWKQIFAETKPQYVLRLEVWAEPKEDWAKLTSETVSKYQIEIHTSQQAGKPAEGGQMVFDNIDIPFTAEVSLEKVVWNETGYVKRLQSEETSIRFVKEELSVKINQLKNKIFSGGTNEADRSERAIFEADSKKHDSRLIEIKSLLDKLPDAYREIGLDESRRFHYSVFLESAEGKRKLLVLTTGN